MSFIMKINTDFIYPVGSIYISINSTNPSKWFGGTWVAFGSGRTLVGVDTNQTEFGTVQKTGGSKYLQEHEHVTTTGLYKYEYSYGINGQVYKAQQKLQDLQVWSGGVANITTGNSGNLQPYITVYMWKRTA